MEKKKARKISGFILLLIGVLTYAIYWITGYYCEEPPQWLFIICSLVFFVFGASGFLLILVKKDDNELDMDLEKTMRERNYNRR